jgi:hypothetical protein
MAGRRASDDSSFLQGRALTTEPERLGPSDRRLVGLVRAAAPELAEAAGLAVAFAGMVRDKDGSRLDGWLDAAATSGLASFARGLRQDLAAVRAALALPWEHEPGRGADQPAEGDQAPDARPRRVRSAAPARPRSRLMAGSCRSLSVAAGLHRKCGRAQIAIKFTP